MKHRVPLLIIILASSLAGAQISPQFFGMATSITHPWPSTVNVPFSSWRSLGATVRWADINTAPGVYDWSRLDHMLEFTSQYGQSTLYTVYYTPSWASSCPSCACLQDGRTDGGCYPPNDLNADGTGSDQHLQDFITALMQHEGPGKIQYLEVWNEPNISTEYAGTIPQLLRMAQDIRTVAQSYDPNVKVTTPAETGDGPIQQGEVEMNWLGQYFAAGGGGYADIVAMHGYVLQNPEDIITRVNNAEAQMAQYGQSGKPLFITEGGWPTPFPVDQQPGFAFRHHLAMLSTPAQRFYLFMFNAPNQGNLWDQSAGQITPAGSAYQLYYGWLVGATMTTPCQTQSSGSTVWSCSFTKPPNIKAEVIWDTGLPFGQTTTVSVPTEYGSYLDLYGHTYTIKNHQVPIGYDPIVLVGHGTL